MQSAQIKRSRRRRHRYAAPIGGAMVLLAVIGFITVIVLSVQATHNILDNSDQKRMFEHLILPVVMFDPVPFESAEHIRNSELLMYSMWSALTSDSRADYTYNENQELQVPAADLDRAVRTLFGGVVTLEHRDFGDFETQFIYNPDERGSGVYYVSVAARLSVYTPRVTDITRVGDYYYLTVDYIPPGDAWTVGFGAQPAADKTMIYVMSRRGGWHIVSVRDPIGADIFVPEPE